MAMSVSTNFFLSMADSFFATEVLPDPMGPIKKTLFLFLGINITKQ
jgi:hypothetical protein